MEPTVSTSQDNLYISKVSSKINNKQSFKNEKKDNLRESMNLDKDKEVNSIINFSS